MKGHYHYHYHHVPFPPSVLPKLGNAITHVPSWVLLALVVGALLLGWGPWTHGQSNTLAGLAREARSFIRGLGRKVVYVAAFLLALALFSQTEPFLRTLELSRTPDEWILLLGTFAVASLIFFVLGQFGVYLWVRHKRSSEASNWANNDGMA